MNLGTVDAPVKVIEFVDFGCGFCRKFQLETFPALRAEFIETQMIEWKFMPFISGMFTNSAVVTEAAECALDQDARIFGALADRLWADQGAWKGSSEPEALVRGWATAFGADGAAFDQCMQDDRRLARVTSATALAAELGVRSTPTFWIVGAGPVQGALPLDIFRDLFRQVHAEVTGTAG
jgi:protein-disulfide isomerase